LSIALVFDFRVSPLVDANSISPNRAFFVRLAKPLKSLNQIFGRKELSRFFFALVVYVDWYRRLLSAPL
jgi:hypothetical protein